MRLSNPSYAKAVLGQFLGALREDLGVNGDLTTKALLGEGLGVAGTVVRADFIVKAAGIVAGVDELKFILSSGALFFNKLEFKIFKHNGDKVKVGDILASIKGDAADILKLERTALNFLQRLSGIATLTRQFVSLVSENVLVVPTRKTFWGMLDKAACISGGGGSHRINLSDAILIKNNHLTILQRDFDGIFKRLVNAKKTGRFIEIEVENFMDFKMVLEAYDKYFKNDSAKDGQPIYIMLDNMKPTGIKKIVEFLKASKFYKNIFLEASGGVNLKNVKKYAMTGVDIISVGALTHSAPALDISMKIV